MTPYPRDMIGYGAAPPDADWPGKARIALQFVVNYEEGGENCILHGDAASEAFLSEIVGAQPWPGQRHMNMESIYEYGSRAGFWRLLRLFRDRGMPVTVFGVATALARNPAAVAAMQEAGWEIASHGLKWVDYKDAAREAERADIEEAVRLHAALTGADPLGFYQGRTSEQTVDLVAQDGRFLYSADVYADDLPYWRDAGGRQMLMVPYTLDANDMRFATAQGFNSGDQFFSYLKDSFDLLYDEGAASPKMLSIGLHCRLVGRPGRAAALARFLDYVRAFDDVWIATRLDIARHWIRRHPPPGGYRPSRMGRALFLELFGGIFEHSPWVAESAYAAGLTAQEDGVEGLHAAMRGAMRAGAEAQRMDLLLKHPDLAGRLAAAQRLTPESAHEQASAGLDSLTDEEAQLFAQLNDAYKARFGIPYILAVKGRTKAEIIADFKTRLASDRAQELATAFDQVERIALLRLAALPGFGAPPA